jgi:hypothetical protein
MSLPNPGESIWFFDARRQERKPGTVIATRRAVNRAWHVAVVQLWNGEEVQVHPDWIEAAWSFSK